MTHKPTPETRALAEQLSAYGIPQDDIAKLVKVSPKTLREHYAEELETGSIKATAKVAGALFKAATGTGQGAITAAIFWMKTRAGWRETSNIEHSGSIDGASSVQIYLPDNGRNDAQTPNGTSGTVSS